MLSEAYISFLAENVGLWPCKENFSKGRSQSSILQRSWQVQVLELSKCVIVFSSPIMLIGICDYAKLVNLVYLSTKKQAPWSWQACFPNSFKANNLTLLIADYFPPSVFTWMKSFFICYGKRHVQAGNSFNICKYNQKEEHKMDWNIQIPPQYSAILFSTL